MCEKVTGERIYLDKPTRLWKAGFPYYDPRKLDGTESPFREHKGQMVPSSIVAAYAKMTTAGDAVPNYVRVLAPDGAIGEGQTMAGLHCFLTEEGAQAYSSFLKYAVYEVLAWGWAVPFVHTLNWPTWDFSLESYQEFQGLAVEFLTYA